MTTIYDIAKAAGVTATTVSNVLHGKGSVSAATRARVMQYVQDMKYSPNMVARSLIQGRTKIIGLVLRDLNSPFFSEITTAVESLAYQADLRVFVSTFTTDNQVNQHMLQDLALRRVDGILVLSSAIKPRELQTFSLPNLPLVYCLGESDASKIFPAVSFDFYQGGRLAAEHLLALEHRNIGIITHKTPEGGIEHFARVNGMLETLSKHQITVDEGMIKAGQSCLEDGRAAAYELLSGPQRPTAIFTTNDLMAIGTISAAWQLGIRIPEDLSVIGFDDISLARFTTPPLTTIKLDTNAMAKQAIELLQQTISQPDNPSPPLIPVRLVERASTGFAHR
ncbi:LacI family DNA-binding transcriptional regulator [Dictyobacter arantiisoli]|uniref:LacI family transcriptional regulator n=1 Tax=Dictyobacter arantiisoli TaxID=2014874 RepID=A0A5A5TK05_9CHLR|nr:LacI family DNA-binding transcriptional regulator [Dictyobacter arantiisoli]GCF11585.1 LacI family transcriptional regulator [Dictyobacter arantiisoli]